MEVIEIDLDHINGRAQRNPQSLEDSRALIASIKQNGLIQPITVRKNRSKVKDEKPYILVSGDHRVFAFRVLGRDTIPALVMDDEKCSHEMIEISENLHRQHLSSDARGLLIYRYAKLLEAKTAGTDSPPSLLLLTDGRKAGPQHQKGLVTTVAKATGIHPKTVQRALRKPKAKVEPTPADKLEAALRRLVAAHGHEAVKEMLTIIEITSSKKSLPSALDAD